MEEYPPCFLVSDTHFDHTNIIKYTNRLFPDVHTMNRAMIRNWNAVVGPGDRVFFLGDLTYGRHHKPASYWLGRLNGTKTMIRGSHDDGIRHTLESFVVKYEGIYFYLVHNPRDIPPEWNGWAIHGHTHNKDPFIDFNRKRINVSVERVNYAPVRIDAITALIKRHEARKCEVKK